VRRSAASWTARTNGSVWGTQHGSGPSSFAQAPSCPCSNRPMETCVVRRQAEDPAVAPLVSIVLGAWNPREDRLREAVGSAPDQRDCDDRCRRWIASAGRGDLVLRSLEHAPVRGEQEIATFYRRHGQAQSANLARALEHESLVVDRYFERHPEQAGSWLEREARANLLVVRARAAASLGRGRREQLRLLARAFALHPRRTFAELARVRR
jgi:hypothetical protein